MNWNVFFEHLVTSDTTRLWFAKLAVASWWPWALGTLFLLLVTFSAVIIFFRKDVMGPRKKFLVAGFIISWGAWILLVTIQLWFLRADRLLYHHEVSDYWQLSPDGVTTFLDYLSWLGGTELVLFVVIPVWMLAFFLAMKTSPQREADENDDQQDDTSGDVGESDKYPVMHETSSKMTYNLLFLGDSEGNVVEAQFDDDSVIDVYETHRISFESLYFQVLDDSPRIHISSKGPSYYDAKCVQLPNGEFQVNEKKIAINQSFDIKGIRFKIVSSDSKESAYKRALSSFIVIGLILFFILASQMHAAGKPVNYENDSICFSIPKDNDNTRLTYVKEKDAEHGLWQVSGELKIDAPALVAIQKKTGHRLQVAEGNVQDVEWSLTDWKTNMRPIHIKILFDLNRDVIYHSHSILYGDGRSRERNFWDALINTILSSFDLDDAGHGDIVSVYSTRKCGNATASEDSPIYYDDGGRFAESVTRTGIENRIRKVIFGCTYLGTTSTKFADSSTKILESDLPTDVMNHNIKNADSLMLIIRWDDTPLKNEPYIIMGSKTPLGKVLIIEVVNVPDALQESPGKNVIRLVVPSDPEMAGKNKEQLKQLVMKLEDMAVANTSIIKFSATTSSLIDAETAGQMKLILVEDEATCKSPSMKLDWQHQDERYKSKIVFFFLSMAGLMLLLTLSLIIPSFRNYHNDGGEGNQ